MAAAFAFMTISLMRSFLPLYASQLIKMSTVQVGVLISATFAVQLVTVPLVGWFADKIGRRKVAIVGFTASAIVFLSFLLVKTPSQLLLASGIVSVGISASSLLLLGVIPEVTPDKFYGTAVGVYGAFEDLGGIFGPLVLGLVWTALSPVAIFAVGSVAQLVGGILIFAAKSQKNSISILSDGHMND
jgi:MFS family permease